MSRRLLFVAGVVAALAVGACSGTPAAPPISDPKEILTKAVEAAQKAKTVHFKADIAGSIALDLTGQGSSAPLELTGTTVEGDIDIGGGNVKGSFSAPALFGLSGEAIVIGKDSYLKVSLFGDKYQKSTNATEGPLGAVSNPQKTIADLQKTLDELPTPPTKAPDEKCGDKDCYRVTIPVPGTNVGGLLGGALGGALGSAAPDVSGTGTVDIWVQKDDLRPVKLEIAADGGAQGKLTATIELTKWDEPVSISAPPADQVSTPSPSPSAAP